jgi:hypothetical protein
LDPCALYGDEKTLVAEIEAMIRGFNIILNLDFFNLFFKKYNLLKIIL